MGGAEVDDTVRRAPLAPPPRTLVCTGQASRRECCCWRRYGGVLRAPCYDQASAQPEPLEDEEQVVDRDIILLRNARDQYETPRMLDIKIGEVTAVTGWQGKVGATSTTARP